jgi:hypothetical protein
MIKDGACTLPYLLTDKRRVAEEHPRPWLQLDVREASASR